MILEHSSVFYCIFLDFPKQFMYRHKWFSRIYQNLDSSSQTSQFLIIFAHVTFLNVPLIYSLNFNVISGCVLKWDYSNVHIDNFYCFQFFFNCFCYNLHFIFWTCFFIYGSLLRLETLTHFHISHNFIDLLSVHFYVDS